MKIYKVKSNIKHDGTLYVADDEIKLDNKTAKTLIKAGAIIDPNAEDEKEDKPTSIDEANRDNEKKDDEKNAEGQSDSDEDGSSNESSEDTGEGADSSEDNGNKNAPNGDGENGGDNL